MPDVRALLSLSRSTVLMIALTPRPCDHYFDPRPLSNCTRYLDTSTIQSLPWCLNDDLIGIIAPMPQPYFDYSLIFDPWFAQCDHSSPNHNQWPETNHTINPNQWAEANHSSPLIPHQPFLTIRSQWPEANHSEKVARGQPISGQRSFLTKPSLRAMRAFPHQTKPVARDHACHTKKEKH